MKIRRNVILSVLSIVLLSSLIQQNIYILVFYSLLLWALLPFKKWWRVDTCALLLFTFFYTFMSIFGDQTQSGFVTISYIVTPVAFYRLGYYLMTEYTAEIERFRLLLLIGVTYLLNLFILTIADVSIVGIVNDARTFTGVSADSDTLSATLYGLMASLGIGCIGAAFSRNIKPIMRLCFFLLVGLSLLTVVHLVNRGGLIILICSLFITILLRNKKEKAKIVIYLGLLLTIGVFVLHSDMLNHDILMAYEQRNNVGGYEATTIGGRTELWITSFNNMLTHPLGWTQKSYAHNLWLDLAKVGGWFSLAPFLIVTIMLFKNILKCLKKHYSSFHSAIIVLNVAMLLAASIEPVIEGSMLFFSLLMLVWGMTASISKEQRYLKIR